MPFDFDCLVDRTHTASLKWDRYQNRDIIPLWVADMDFRVPPAVLEALRTRIEHPVFGYSVPTQRLVSAVRSWLWDRYRWDVEPSWLVWLPGVVSGFNVACRSVGEANEEVLSPTPVYPPFFKAPGSSGRRLVTTPLIQEGGRWTYDPDLFKKTITPRTRLFLFCHPHNPTGTVFSQRELEIISKICLEKRVIICSDEIHCDILLEENARHIPLAALDPETGRNTITLMAPSKTFNIPGLGFSFAVISNPELRRRFEKEKEGIVPSVNLLGFEAAIAAYEQASQWLSALNRYLAGNRSLVEEAVSHMPGLSLTRPEATYLAWIDANDLKVPDPVLFFEKAGVGLSDGRDFGSPGFVRLNFGCSKSLLIDAFERMKQAVNSKPQ